MKERVLIDIVERTLGVSLKQMRHSRKDRVIMARRILTVLLFEEDYTSEAIAVVLHKSELTIDIDLEKIDQLLTHDRTFKRFYLACITKITEMEDKQ